MFGFFFCTPFPLRILAWSFVVPRSNFHPPLKAFNLIDLKAGDNWPSHLPHEMELEMWSTVDRDGCFVKLSRSINFVPPEVYIYTHRTHIWICKCICICMHVDICIKIKVSGAATIADQSRIKRDPNVVNRGNRGAIVDQPRTNGGFHQHFLKIQLIWVVGLRT